MALRRLTTLLAGSAVAVMLAAFPASAAPTTDQPAPAAAGWLAGQMVDGERFETEFDGQVFPDQGLTVDAVFAFAAAGVAGDRIDAALDWLATPDVLGGYLGTAFGSAFAGSYAKLAFAAQVTGRDPSEVGGVDLIAELLALQDDTGRFVDQPADQDFSNAFSQSFAILALDRTAEGAPPEAVAFLVGEQCPDGGFPLLFAQSTCNGDVDSTAMAVQALAAAGAADAAADGLAWLVDRQQPNGGFEGSPPTNVVNANSTGLAAQALRAAGEDAAADQAVGFLRGQQIGCDGPVEQRGAIAYDENGFDPANVRRATAQAILGLVGVGMADLDGSAAAPEVPQLACETMPPASPTPSPTETPGGQGGGLPVTGMPIPVLVGAGLALVVVGALAVWAARRRRPAG
jgi:hypothetical protein